MLVKGKSKEAGGGRLVVMSLSKISSSSSSTESKVQEEIFSSIDKSDNIIFNAGAGSGKTYALTECLKYIIKKYSDDLIHNNQKIMCITYTNVATSEIKERLGNSDLVVVSTIHERLWSLIKNYRNELLKIHVEKLTEEGKSLQFDLNDNHDEKVEKKFVVYRELSDASKSDFKDIAIKNKDIFYRYYDKSAKEFRAAMEGFFLQYSDVLKNVGDFKKIVGTLYKIDNYRYCLNQIEIKNPKYYEVRYEDKYNTDVLHRMIISHDTLLDYSLKIVKSYDLLKRAIHDSYPYILIDEYQDTNEHVVEILRLVDEHAKLVKRKLFVGYFGDAAQNIYEEGVGGELVNIHQGLKSINKQFNRRSHSEVIDVINNIRNDEIKQKSIFDDCAGGSVKFYTGLDEEKNLFIDKYVNEWKINTGNKLHCLVLLNKNVAEFNGFLDVYNCFSDTAYYKKNYKMINSELLSNDLSKLGSVQSLCFAIINFLVCLNNSKTSLTDLIDKRKYSKLTFQELSELISLFKKINGRSLGDQIKDIFDKYENSGDRNFKKIVEGLMGLDRYSYQGFRNYLLDELFFNVGNRRVEEFKFKLNELFDEELFSKVDKESLSFAKQKFNEIIEGEIFSYLEKEEIIDFKEKLHEFIKDKKYFDPQNFVMKEFVLKLDNLFEKNIFSLIDVDEVDIARDKIDGLLDVDYSQWILWYEFIKGDQNTDVIYHTYHGTKGAEYDNVIIVMQNDFGKVNRNKFSSFFENCTNPSSLDKDQLGEFQNTKNLLYVSCSRAIKNLRILYLDDISEFKGGIEGIFGEVYQYKTN